MRKATAAVVYEDRSTGFGNHSASQPENPGPPRLEGGAFLRRGWGGRRPLLEDKKRGRSGHTTDALQRALSAQATKITLSPGTNKHLSATERVRSLAGKGSDRGTFISPDELGK